MKCLSCNQNEAQYKEGLGFYPCGDCNIRGTRRPQAQVEFTSDAIKEGRKEHWQDIHGSHRQGIPSAEYRDRYGSEEMKKQGFSSREIEQAKPVWNDDTFYNS